MLMEEFLNLYSLEEILNHLPNGIGFYIEKQDTKFLFENLNFKTPSIDEFDR